MPTNFTNQATSKYLGYVYQVLIAIEQCFHSKSNDIIWIECKGDVYDGNTSTEVKHHFQKSNLTNNSNDFWKTLKNLVVEDVSEFNSLIFHTTQNVVKNTIFYEWNDLTKNQKYKRLKNHTPSKSIQLYYKEVIEDYSDKELKKILEKLTIKSSQIDVKEKWENLKNASIFTLIEEERRDDAFHWVYGYVNKQAINDRYNWHIKKNEFDISCRCALNKWVGGNIPFDFIDKTEIDCSNKSYLFVDEMKKIKLREKSIEIAVADYIRSQHNRIKLLKTGPSAMPEILDSYDRSLLERQEAIKDRCSYGLREDQIETEHSLEKSRNLYHVCMSEPLMHIPNVDNTQKYYQDGRMHHNVNEGYFFWRFCEEDLI